MRRGEEVRTLLVSSLCMNALAGSSGLEPSWNLELVGEWMFQSSYWVHRPWNL